MTIKYAIIRQPLNRRSDGKLWHFTEWGGYPLIYFTEDQSTLCAHCANGENGSEASETSEDPQWLLIAADVLWEGVEYCDHCSERIEGAYYDKDEDTDE